ncbi:MAG: hypothetical protein WCI57_05095 [Candidatus Berkelbacteria bacterium]
MKKKSNKTAGTLMIIFGLMMVGYSILFFGNCAGDAQRSVLLNEKIMRPSAYLLFLLGLGEVYFGIRAIISEKAKNILLINYATWVVFAAFVTFFDNYKAQVSIIYGSILPAIITFQIYTNLANKKETI